METAPVFDRLEAIARQGGDVFGVLRELPIDTVGNILLGIPDQYPAAQGALPRMAADIVQDQWTGTHGMPLLLQTCAFVRAVELGFLKYTGRSLDETRILDYGCGWGRIIRLMYKFTAPENIYGCDSWSKSIGVCNEYGVRANLKISDTIPREVPFSDVRFDLIYAFSVFTHLSEKTAKAVMAACRKAVADDGLMVVTIRPATYWHVHVQNYPNRVDLEAMLTAHRETGFAFTPDENIPPNGGELTYGDTSMTLDYIRENWTDWEIVGVDSLLQDAYQIPVFLKPRL
jgi:SAM-dependent methyltransferase